MDRIVQWFTVGRAIAVALTLIAGGIGTGIGFFLGEGAARATFSALWQDHEKRLVSVEEHVKRATDQNTRILEGLAELKGEVKALRREVRP